MGKLSFLVLFFILISGTASARSNNIVDDLEGDVVTAADCNSILIPMEMQEDRIKIQDQCRKNFKRNGEFMDSIIHGSGGYPTAGRFHFHFGIGINGGCSQRKTICLVISF